MRDEANDNEKRPVVAQDTPGSRAYLRAMIAWLKANRRGFSYRSFAMKAGFSWPELLKLVSDGKRNLSPDSIERVCHGLGLERREAEAFEALVELGQADTDARKHRAYTKLSKLAQRDPVKRLEASQYEAYSKWYTFVLRELASLPGFVRRARRAGARPPLQDAPGGGAARAPEPRAARAARARARRAPRAGGAQPFEPGPRCGRWRSATSIAGDPRAIESLDLVPMGERNVSGVTVALSRRQYARVIELIQVLRREVLAISEETLEGDEPQEIHQLAFALIPLTQPATPPRGTK